MERLMLVAPLAALLALEVYHCARRNSWRFSALFFGAAVVFGIIRGNIIGFITWYHGDSMPYAVRGAAVKLGFTSLSSPSAGPSPSTAHGFSPKASSKRSPAGRQTSSPPPSSRPSSPAASPGRSKAPPPP